MKINSITALAGAGKTHTMIKEINHNISSSNEKYIVLAPTIRLCDQIAKDLHDVKTIHSEVDDIKHSSVELRSMISQGQKVICSTHQSFAHVIKGSEIDLSEYNLIIDEVPAALLEAQIQLDKESFNFITELVAFNTSERFNGFTEIHPKDLDVLKHKLSKDAPELYKTKNVKLFIESVANGAYITLIPSDALSEFRSRINEDNARLDTVSLLRPEVLTGAKSCTVMSAFMDFTEFSMVMKAQGVMFNEQDIQVRYKEHTNGDRLKVKYFSEKLNSKRFANQKNIDGKSNIQIIVDLIQGELAGEQYIFNANVMHRDLFKNRDGEVHSNAHEVTSIHGVNHLQSIHNAVYLPAMNPNSSSTKVLEYLGLSSQDIIFARNQLLAYQFLMRTSLRDPNQIEDVSFYCIDRLTAEFISTVFGCAIEKIQIDLVKEIDGREANGGERNGAGRKKNSPELDELSKEIKRLSRHKTPDLNKIADLKAERKQLREILKAS